MSEALAEMRPVAQLARWTPEQRELIKRTVAHDATDDELAMFLHIASKAGLDPLQKQIHFTKRGGRVVIIAGIDGLQARASREADFEGIVYGVVCQKDEFAFDATEGKVVKHTYNAFADRGPIVGAWATVRRRGKLPFTAVVRFAEYNQPSSQTWKQMPHVMLAKVARSTALRLAYPEQFGGLYEQAEMDQVDVVRDAPQTGITRVLAALRPQLPPDMAPPLGPEDVTPPPSVGFGSYRGRELASLSDNELTHAIAEGTEKLDGNKGAKWAGTLSRNLKLLQDELEKRLPGA